MRSLPLIALFALACREKNTDVDFDMDGYAEDVDCDDGDATIHPDAEETPYNGVDEDCDPGTPDDDLDGDGFGVEEDCDDADATRVPGGTETPYNGVDDDCNEGTPDDDLDGDGHGIETDCDDRDPSVFPDAVEVCNGADDDCDGEIDDAVGGVWYSDADGDGFGDPATGTADCQGDEGTVADDSDCDDTDAAVNIAADERCDGVDNDCDGATDEPESIDAATWYADADADGYGDRNVATRACEQADGWSADATDCDDTLATVNPGATEVCNGDDDDCDGTTDEPDAADAATWYVDADADGHGTSAVTTVACTAPTGFAGTSDDCDDGDASAFPGNTEVCDDVDNDCDGTVDDGLGVTWYRDYDRDGYGDPGRTVVDCAQPAGYTADASDCDDTDAAIHPGATEVCNNDDDDCDGTVDEGVSLTWYLDYDGDGYGDANRSTEACRAPSSLYVSDATDCDDTEALVHPNATPGCDGGDWDCDGLVDSDGDGDGYADATCGGDDCDDSDANVLPEVNGGCALGTTCDDVLANGYSVGDGTYTIDPDGFGTGLDPFDVYCDMTTDGGGWTRIDYAADLAFQQHFTGGDQYRFLPRDFTFTLTAAQITALQGLSTEGSQVYEGRCNHVIHHYYRDGASYGYAFGFRFFDGTETARGVASYLPYDITVVQDGCRQNGGEGGAANLATLFEINSPLVPVLNVQCRDCGDNGELFGSPLTNNPAWLR